MKYVVQTPFVVIFVFILYTAFVYTPVHLYHENVCTEKGYSKSRTSVNLTGLCYDVFGSNSKPYVIGDY